MAVGLLGANPQELGDDGERGTRGWGEKDMRYGVGKELDAIPIGTSPTMTECVTVPVLDRTGDIGGSDASTEGVHNISITYLVTKSLTYLNRPPAHLQSQPQQLTLAAHSQISSSAVRACSVSAQCWSRFPAASGRV